LKNCRKKIVDRKDGAPERKEYNRAKGRGLSAYVEREKCIAQGGVLYKHVGKGENQGSKGSNQKRLIGEREFVGGGLNRTGKGGRSPWDGRGVSVGEA